MAIVEQCTSAPPASTLAPLVLEARRILLTGDSKAALAALLPAAVKLEDGQHWALLAQAQRLLVGAFTTLGHYEEAAHAQRAGTEAALRSGDDAIIAELLSNEPALPYFRGDYIAAIEHAARNMVHLKAMRLSEDRCVYYLCSSYLRLGDLDTAERFALQGLAVPAERRGEFGVATLSIRLGDIEWWRLVSAQVPFSTRPALTPAMVRERCAVATTHYARAHEQTENSAPYYARFARTGLARTRLLHAYVPAELAVLESHVGWLSANRLFLDSQLARLDLAIILATHGMWQLGWSWIKPVVQSAQSGAGKPFEAEVLRMGGHIRHHLGDVNAGRALSHQADGIASAREQELGALSRRLHQRATVADGPAAARGEVDLLSSIRAKVYERLDRPIKVGELARLIGMPRRTLEHACNTRFKQTPKALLDAIRLEEARTRMLDGCAAEGGVSAIARSIGFPSYRSFLRAYKAAYGTTPASGLGGSAMPQ